MVGVNGDCVNLINMNSSVNQTCQLNKMSFFCRNKVLQRTFQFNCFIPLIIIPVLIFIC